MTVDLSSLPPPEVIETISFETIVQDIKDEIVARYPDAAEVIDLESEPLVKLIEAFAYRELTLRARYNDEARALLLAFAVDADLDHIGATYYQEERLVVTPANNTTIPPTPAVMETNADYRQRLALKPEGYSTAGPTGAYEYHARSADGRIKDAKATSPIGGTTEVFILSRLGDGTPDAELLQIVEDALNPEEIRPVSEEVIVTAASIQNYTLDITPTIWAGPNVEPTLSAIATALAAFAADKHRLKTDIDHSAIDAAAHVAGVKKILINSPAVDIVCGPGQAPYCIGIVIRDPIIVSS